MQADAPSGASRGTLETMGMVSGQQAQSVCVQQPPPPQKTVALRGMVKFHSETTLGFRSQGQLAHRQSTVAWRLLDPSHKTVTSTGTGSARRARFGGVTRCPISHGDRP